MYVRTFVVSLVLADTSKNVPARIRYINKWHDRKGYKLWNNPVEGTALKTKAFLVCAETTEILCNKQNTYSELMFTIILVHLSMYSVHEHTMSCT